MQDSARHSIARQDYMDTLLYIMAERGGRVTTSEGIEAVGRALRDYFTDRDYEPLISKPDEARWQNDVRWARDQLMRQGLVRPFQESGRGIWELSGAGRTAAAGILAPTPAHRPSPSAGRHRTTSRPAPEGGRPHGQDERLRLLAQAFSAAIAAPVGKDANPAMGSVYSALERVLADAWPIPAPASRAPTSTPSPASPRATTVRGPVRPPPSLTTSAGPSVLDLARLNGFVTQVWHPVVEAARAAASEVRERRIQDLDQLAALPLAAALFAAENGWVTRHAGSLVAVRAAAKVLGPPGQHRGILGELLKRPLGTAGVFPAPQGEPLLHPRRRQHSEPVDQRRRPRRRPSPAPAYAP